MKNRYEIIDENTIVNLEDQFGNFHEIVVNKKSVIIYANYDKREWKVVIDADDLEKVDKAIDGRWYINICKGTIYAFFCKQKAYNRTYISMHRLIVDCPDDLVVDHCPHHYGLDNRKENLTPVTPSFNNQNQIKNKCKTLSFFKS